MVKKKLIYILYIILFLFLPHSLFADQNLDQWMDSPKSYKDLIDEGFEVKGYSMNKINTDNGLILLMFVSVLQKNKEVYECQEYQTLNQNLETLDMSLVCRQLVQPFKEGLGT